MNLNYLVYRAKYRFGRSLPLSSPVDVSMELSSACTNRCGYCYHADPKKLPFTRGHMPLDIAKKILKESAEIGVHSVKTNYRGESTLNPHFEEITAYAKSLARGSTFIDRITNSNFNFRDQREDIFRGLCNQTKVKISFDSFRKDIFEKQRLGSRYEATLANIEKFYNYPGRSNIIIIQSVRTNLNKDEDLAHEIKSRWPNALISIRDCVEGRVASDLSETVVRRRDVENRESCIQAHVRLMFRFDGIAGACCPDIKGQITLGDIRHMTVKEIFNSEVARQLRVSLKKKTAFENDPCKSCSSFESYKGFKPNWDS